MRKLWVILFVIGVIEALPSTPIEASSVVRRDLATVSGVRVSVATVLQSAGIRREEAKAIEKRLVDKVTTALQHHGVSVQGEGDTTFYITITMIKGEAGERAALLVEARLADRVTLNREIPGSQDLTATIWNQSALELVAVEAVVPQAERSAVSLTGILGSKIAQAQKEYSRRR